jgi:hypothetical protein
MNTQTQEWAETRSIKQTKLPKKTWIKQQDGSSYAIVKMIRDKDGCVIRIEPIEAQEVTGAVTTANTLKMARIK